MAYGKIETLVSVYAEEAAARLGYEIVDIEYVKEGGRWVLRIYIDKEGGISTDDCEKLSRNVEKMLDEKDPIEHSYSLEISSPGLDRPLKKESDFIRFKNRQVDLKLYRAKGGSKKYRGELLGLKDNVISIEDESGATLVFEREEVASIKLSVIFD